MVKLKKGFARTLSLWVGALFFILTPRFAYSVAFAELNVNWNGQSIVIEASGGLGGIPGTRSSWIECFKTGKCTGATLDQKFFLYPIARNNGDFLAGCYRKQGAVLVRTGDFQVNAQKNAVCPPEQNAQINVIVFGRQVCPNGTTSCDVGGRLEMGCLIQNLHPLGSNNPFTFTQMDCSNGQLIVRDPLNLQTIVETQPTATPSTPPSSCPEPGNSLAMTLYEYEDPVSASPQPLSPEATLKVVVEKTNEPCSSTHLCSWFLESQSGTNSLDFDGVSWVPVNTAVAQTIPAFSAWQNSSSNSFTISGLNKKDIYRVRITYQTPDGDTCTDHLSFKHIQMCAKGFGGSGCVACGDQFYKDHIGNDGCTACPSKIGVTVSGVPHSAINIPGTPFSGTPPYYLRDSVNKCAYSVGNIQ